MYERLTYRARKVMTLANQEAQRLNHEFIGTEHILLGLIKEGTGNACVLMHDLGIAYLDDVRKEVDKIVQVAPEKVPGTAGKLPQTPRAKLVIEHAVSGARELGHDYVGTEHLFYGLVAEPDGVAHQVLAKFNVDASKVLNAIKEMMKGIKEKVEKEVGAGALGTSTRFFYSPAGMKYTKLQPMRFACPLTNGNKVAVEFDAVPTKKDMLLLESFLEMMEEAFGIPEGGSEEVDAKKPQQVC